jgi:MoaA/NifB/PqqE/SkfB family radical SAM enzyme
LAVTRGDESIDHARDELLCPTGPLSLLVEITSQCNLRCRMCPLTTGASSSAGKPGHMSDRTWSEVMPLARQAKQVFIAGFGEPLTNPHCLDLLQQLNDEGIRTTLSTNGLALNPTTASRLAALPFLVHINVSIDAADTATYREIRGGNLDRAFAGLENLVAAMPDTSRITVSSIAMRENIGQLADFPPFLERLGIKTLIVQGLNDYTAYSKSQSLVGAHLLAEHLHRLRSSCAERGIELVLTTGERTSAEENHLDSVLAQYYDGGPSPHTETRQCMLPWEQPYVDKDGRVFPCCIAGASSQSQLGQLGEPGQGRLSDIWVGGAYRAFRQALLDAATTPTVCRTCTIVPAGPHPLTAYRATLEGDSHIFKSAGAVTVRFRNTGTRAWATGTVQVGTATPWNRASEAEHATWLSGDRPCSFTEPSVAPGALGTFTFQTYLPARRALEEFQLVANATHWLPNTRFAVQTPTAMHHPIRTLHWMAGEIRRRFRAQPDLP